MVNPLGTELTRIYVLREGETIGFAARELGRYVQMMDGSVEVETVPSTAYRPDEQPGIYLGLLEDFGLPAPGLENLQFDDYVHIDVGALEGVIAGSNPRSVLLGVYRFLEGAGCSWVRPGEDGECIPQRDLTGIAVKLDEAPSYRYRGLCIEGAVSYENMLENIDWAPKAGFNSYFLEFIIPHTFFDRWYRHLGNESLEPEPLTVEMVLDFKQGMEREITKRGLIYQAVGHGWTCEPFGVQGLGWDPVDYEVDEDVTSLLAEVGGERKLHRNIPLNTNLCYSNPEARRAVVDYAVKHMRANPFIDVLHVWMADDSNNHCECDNCRGTRPSDFLVMLLNEMDAAFAKESIDTRIAFPAYLDLLWPPERERLHNPDRFVLLFAPITRSYDVPYDTDTKGIELPDFERNKLQFPADIRENLAFLEKWQEFFDGDAETYEYYFMWDSYFDPGYYETAKVLNADIKLLHGIGLNGIVSDQSQRSFFPTGFGMYVMARTLWDDSVEVDGLATEYFSAAFGEEGELCREYMATLSRLFDPPSLRRGVQTWGRGREVAGADPDAVARLGNIPGVIDAFGPCIERNMQLENACRAKSWEYLAYHADISKALARALQARARGDDDEAHRLWHEVVDLVQRNEMALQPVLDVFEFNRTLGRVFR